MQDNEESTHPSFEELGLSEPIRRALADLGYEEPTPIQLLTIPELLAGRDVIGQAQTGTGKTAGFCPADPGKARCTNLSRAGARAHTHARVGNADS
jgi:hypothetical protein